MLTETQKAVAANLGWTEAEYLAAQAGIDVEDYRLQKAVKELTPLELKAARGLNVTPERYVLNKIAAGAR